MSEFKFACPVCGQHITADSSSSGGHIECPTCFQKIVVPQAPSGNDSKFILSASQVGKPRPASLPLPAETAPVPASGPLIPVLVGVLLVCGAGALFALRGKIFKPKATPPPALASAESNLPAPVSLRQAYPIPTNFVWSLDLTNVAFPETVAAGSILGEGFFCERAILQGGNLVLRQGKNSQADRLLLLRFAARQAEDLAGKVIVVSPDRSPPLPSLMLQSREEGSAPTRKSYKSGYALKVSFGQPANGRIPGRIYICAPDDEKSFVAGTFEAEIRKPPPPKGAGSKTTNGVPRTDTSARPTG